MAATSSPITIRNLADHPELLPMVARWHWSEWGHTDPEGSLEAWTESLRRRTGRAGVPSNYVAFIDGQPVGSASLVRHDMSTRTDLEPWLAGVYVLSDHRGLGVGSALVEDVTAEAARSGHPTLYLYTASAAAFYVRLGWKHLAEEPYVGRSVRIMYLDLR